MNTWPTLTEWWQFSGTLVLEVGLLFLAAKLITLRLRSAQWRRALWQTAVIAMFIVVMGELNGVRGLMRPPSEPGAIVPPQRAVVVTFKDAEMPAEFLLDAAASVCIAVRGSKERHSPAHDTRARAHAAIGLRDER